MGVSPDPQIPYLAPSGESWVSIARRSGINSATFASRIGYGWRPEGGRHSTGANIPNRSLTPSGDSSVSIARDNGVHQATFHKRHKAGLTPEQVATGSSNRLPQSPDGEQWRDVALRHAIGRSTFDTPVANGWDPPTLPPPASEANDQGAEAKRLERFGVISRTRILFDQRTALGKTEFHHSNIQ